LIAAYLLLNSAAGRRDIFVCPSWLKAVDEAAGNPNRALRSREAAVAGDLSSSRLAALNQSIGPYEYSSGTEHSESVLVCMMALFKKLVRPNIPGTEAGAGLLGADEDVQTPTAYQSGEELFSMAGDYGLQTLSEHSDDIVE
jgi:hypothetical protein